MAESDFAIPPETEGSSFELNLLFDDDSGIKNLSDNDQYLYLDKIDTGCFAIDVDKEAEKQNNYVHKHIKKLEKRQRRYSDETCFHRLPVVGQCLRGWQISRERCAKIKTFNTEKGQKVRVFEYEGQCLTSSRQLLRKVFVANLLEKNGDRRVAVKRIPFADKLHLTSLLTEVQILHRLSENPHPNIARLLDYFVDQKRCFLYIVMPLYDCTLSDVFFARFLSKKEMDKPMTIEDDLNPTGFSTNFDVYRKWSAKKVIELMSGREMISSLLEALSYLHETSQGQKVVHRDTKPSNVFFKIDQERKTCRLLLGDFGIAKAINVSRDVTTTDPTKGTPLYRDPEIEAVNKLRHTVSYETLLRGDVWSTGVLIFQIWHNGMHPFAEDNTENEDVTFANMVHHKPVALIGSHDELRKNLIWSMIVREGRLRPTLDMVKQHPYFKSPAILMDFLRQFTEVMGSCQIEVPLELKQKFEEGRHFVFAGNSSDYDTYGRNETEPNLNWKNRLSPKAKSLYFEINEHSLKERRKTRELLSDGSHIVNTYKVEKMIGLARFLRNFDQHHTHYKSMCIAIFGRPDPSKHEMVKFINSEFPLFFIHTISFAAYHLKEFLSLSTQLLSMITFDLRVFASAYYNYLHVLSKDEGLYERLKTKFNYPNEWRSDMSSSKKISCDTNKILNVTQQEEIEIKDEQWYFGHIKLEQAEELLMMRRNPNGAFLVRRSQKRENQLSLSVRVNGVGANDSDIVVHYALYKTMKGFYIYEDFYADSVMSLVNYYQKTPIYDKQLRNVILSQSCLQFSRKVGTAHISNED